MYDVNVIADYFISLIDTDAGDVMTHLKLQKLLYFAQAWHLTLYKKPLFQDKIEAWAHGPVSIIIWNRFRDKGWNPITSDDIISDLSKLNLETMHFLDEVWKVYGQYSAKRLEEITHQEEPWKKVRKNIPEYAACNEEITHQSMISYYSNIS